MKTAVKINILNDDLEITDTINMLQQEILESQIKPFHPVSNYHLNGGDPYIQPFGEPWHIISLQVRAHGDITSNKLSTIQTAAAARKLFRVYPAWIDFADLSFDCFMPADVPLDFIISGRYAAGETEILIFYEASKEATGIFMGYGHIVG